MSEWKEYKIGALAKINSRTIGKSFPFQKILYLETSDVTENKFNEPTEVSIEQSASRAKRVVRDYDILISTVRPNLKHFGLVKEAKENLIVSTGFAVLTPDRKKVNPYFLFAYLSTNSYTNFLISIAEGQTSTYPAFNPDVIQKSKIILPPLYIQQRIASILSAYDALIENNNRRIALLEQIAEQIYKEWFVRMRFPGYENSEFEKGVPKGWEEGNITDVVSVLSGGTPKTEKQEYWDGEICWFAPTDIQNSYYVLSTTKKITESGLKNCNSKLYPVNTIFITARGSVGNCVLNAFPMAMNQSCYALICKNGFGLSQFYLYLLVKDLVAGFKNVANGAVFDTITVSTFERTKIILPNSNALKQFSNCVTPIFEQMKTLLFKTQTLKQTRDLLLPRLIGGKLRVSEL